MARPPTKTSRVRMMSREHQASALEYRRAGLSFREVAQRVGLSKSQVRRLIVDAMDETVRHIASEANLLRAEEIDRLDAMLAGIWLDARRGDHTAINSVLKIMERRARLLGLDAPTRMTHGGDPDAPPIVAAAALLDWRALLGPTPITIEQEHPSPPDAP